MKGGAEVAKKQFTQHPSHFSGFCQGPFQKQFSRILENRGLAHQENEIRGNQRVD